MTTMLAATTIAAACLVFVLHESVQVEALRQPYGMMFHDSRTLPAPEIADVDRLGRRSRRLNPRHNGVRRQRILVTGGMGNIGHALCTKLVDLGCHVVIVDVCRHAGAPHAGPGVTSYTTFYKADIRNSTAVLEIMVKEHITGVIHLAAVSRVQQCLENAEHCRDVNVGGTRVVVDAANVVPSVQWVVFASYCRMYGASTTFHVNESMAHTPLNAYGATKIDAETAIERTCNKTAIVLRLSNVYGGLRDHDERLVPSLVKKCMLHQQVYLAEGQQTMDFVHVDDVVSAFVLAISRLARRSNGRRARAGALATEPLLESFDIMSGTATSASDLLRYVQETTKSMSPVTRIPHDPRFPERYDADPSKAQAVLGFRAQVTDVRVGLALFRDALTSHWVQALEREIADNCPNDVAAAPNELAGPGWVCSTDLASVDKCYFKAVFADENRVFEGVLDSAYRVSGLPGHAVQVCLNTKDNSTYLVSEPANASTRPYAALARVDVFNCTLPDSFLTNLPRNSFKLKQLYSTVEAQFERLRSKNYGLDLDDGQDAWDVRCRVLGRSLRAWKERQAGGGQSAEPSSIAWTKNALQWPKFSDPSCSVDCNLPQVCLFDGRCACPPTAVACSNLDSNIQLATFEQDASPQALVRHLTPESVMQAHAVPLWRHSSEHAYAAGWAVEVGLAKPSPPAEQASLARECSDSISAVQSSYNATSIDVQHHHFGIAVKTHQAIHQLPTIASRNANRGADVWVVPHFQGCEDSITEDARLLPTFAKHYNFSSQAVAIVMQHDYGTCDAFRWTPIEHADTPLPQPFASGATAIAPMGDVLLQCIKPAVTAIVQARSKVSGELYANFRDVRRVKPVLDRAYVLFHKASKFNVMRLRLAAWLMGFGLGAPVLVNTFEPGGDYMSTLNNTQFCLHTRGTTGWATRLADMLYAGCIPVIMIDDTIHPYETLLDYRKFSVRVHERDVTRLRDILSSINNRAKVSLQAHVLRVRDAFMYGLDEDVDRLDDHQGVNPIRLLVMDLLRMKLTQYPV